MIILPSSKYDSSSFAFLLAKGYNFSNSSFDFTGGSMVFPTVNTSLKTMPIYEFREKCREYALQQVDRQKAGFIRLGSIGDYDHPYITLLKEFEGKGVSYCAVCDGPFYTGQDVTIIGGGNTAVTNALELSEICKKLIVVQNLADLTGENILNEKLKAKEKTKSRSSTYICRLRLYFKF